jgi:hypothetical protein
MSRRGRRRGQGQALAEFAMIAPILFLLLFGVIQLGLLFAGQNGLVNGVRDTDRRAVTWRVNDASLADGSILGSVCADIDTELRDQLTRAIPGFQESRLHETIGYHWEANPGPAPSGADPANSFLSLDIQASYDHPLYVPLIGWFFDLLDGNPANPDGAFTLTASEQMRVENPSLPLGTTDANCP